MNNTSFAVIDISTSEITNVILMDADEPLIAPDGFCYIEDDENKAVIGCTYEDGVFTAPPSAPTIPADINAERDRRIDGGFVFEGIVYQSDREARENIDAAATAALGAIMAGAKDGDLRWHGGKTDFAWIAADNSLHTMDARTVCRFGQAAMAHRQHMIFRARQLKENLAKDPDTLPDIGRDETWA